MKTLDELDALYAEATGGPWHVEHTGERGADVYSGSYPWGPDCGVGVVHASGTNAHADAALIVALVNAWPEVRERLRRAEREREAAKEAEDALLELSKWRADCHGYDRDMDYKPRDFDEDTVAELEQHAARALDSLRAALTEEPPR
jgi:hypothetical protein